MELVDVLREKVSSVKVNNQDEFKKAKENYLIQSKENLFHSPKPYRRPSVNSHRIRHFRLDSVKFLNYAIIYLVLVSLTVCEVNGKATGAFRFL